MFEVVQFSVTSTVLLWNRHVQPSITLEQWLHLPSSFSCNLSQKNETELWVSLPEGCITYQYYSVFVVSQWMWHTCCMFRCCAKMPSVICMKIPVWWDVMQFRLVYRHQHFRGVCCFHLQGGPRTKCLTLKTEATSISQMLELVYRHTPIYEVISYTVLGIWNFFVIILVSTSHVVNVCFLCLRWLMTYNIYGCNIVFGMCVCIYIFT